MSITKIAIDALSTANVAHTHRAQKYTKPQRGTIADLGVVSSNTSIDLASSNHYKMVVNGSITMLNPTNIATANGQSGSITFTSNGAFTVSWASQWRFPSGTAPTLSSVAGKQDRVDYFVASSNTVHSVATIDLLGTA